MRLLRNNAQIGFTLVEMMMAVGCSSLMFAALLAAGVALQRSFAAVEGYSLAEGDQLRVQDYIAMDCRRAVSATRDNGSWVNSGGTWSWVSDPNGVATLILTVPNYYYYNPSDPNDQKNGTVLDPTYNSTGAIQYVNPPDGSSTTTISYYKSGSNFIRQVGTDPAQCPAPPPNGWTWTNCAKAIATNVASFNVNAQDLTSRVTCSITFSPRFVYLPGPGPINGTTVFSNTFLRNAVAR